MITGSGELGAALGVIAILAHAVGIVLLGCMLAFRNDFSML